MERILFTLAVATALATAMTAARAETTLYGNLNESINSYDTDAGGDDVNLKSNTSAIGIKGSEDLGSGLSAIYQAEFQFDPADASGFSGRDQWVGLTTNKLGKVRFGTISHTYKSHGAMIDPLYRTSLEGRAFGLQSKLHSGKGENGQGRMTRQIRYDSPSWAGFDFTLDYSLDDDANDASDDNTYAAGAKYKNGGILVFADYITSDAGGDDNAWAVGGSWTFGNFGLYGQYEGDGGLIAQQGVYNPDTAAADWNGDGQNTWFAGASYTWGNTLFFGGYGQADDADTGGSIPNGIDTGYTSWTLAVDHHLSKRTDVYAGYNRLDCNSYAGSVCGSGSIQINIDPGATNQPASGGTQDFFSVGVRHKF
jgi:predicted porin